MNDDQNPLNRSDKPGSSKTMSDYAYKKALHQSDMKDEKDPGSPTDPDEPINTMNKAEAPSITGEQSESGDMPDPESDDDVLASAHDMGVGLGEDREHPQELDIASDVDKAEEYQKTH